MHCLLWKSSPLEVRPKAYRAFSPLLTTARGSKRKPRAQRV
nr:MAG TPA_asm: hypothetical protein [Caudoviricetes sp.]